MHPSTRAPTKYRPHKNASLARLCWRQSLARLSGIPGAYGEIRKHWKDKYPRFRWEDSVGIRNWARLQGYT